MAITNSQLRRAIFTGRTKELQAAFSGLKSYRSGTVTTNVASIAAGATAEFTITVTGAVVGDPVYVGAPAAIEAGLVWSGRVSGANTVTVRLHNTTAGAVDPANATWKAVVFN